MAMTLDQITDLLDELGLTYQRQDEYVFLTMETQIYRDPEKNGNKALTLMIELMEDGEFFTLMAPRAYFVLGGHRDAFLRACARVQWHTKLVQFEWDTTDGEVRPIIELPLEDSSLTSRQLKRCIFGLCSIVDRYHEVLHRAATEGVVALPGDSNPAGDDGPDPAFLARVKAVLAARADGAETAGPADDRDIGPPSML
jgi:hypothetical protein